MVPFHFLFGCSSSTFGVKRDFGITFLWKITATFGCVGLFGCDSRSFSLRTILMGMMCICAFNTCIYDLYSRFFATWLEVMIRKLQRHWTQWRCLKPMGHQIHKYETKKWNKMTTNGPLANGSNNDRNAVHSMVHSMVRTHTCVHLLASKIVPNHANICRPSNSVVVRNRRWKSSVKMYYVVFINIVAL